MKRLIALFLMICLSCSLFPGLARAAQDDAGERANEASSGAKTDIATCKIYTKSKDGVAFSPSTLVMVYDGEKLLRKSYDYSISCSDLQDDGSVTVTVTGMGDYSGSVEVLAAITRVEQTLLVNGVPQDPIVCGQSVQIEASGIGEIRFASDDPSIAEVDAEGWICGTGAGLVAITVSASGNQYYRPAERKIPIRVINPGQKSDSLSGQDKTDEIEKDFDACQSNLFLLWTYLKSTEQIPRWTAGEALWRYEDARELEELRIMVEACKAEEARGVSECVTICVQCGEETAADSSLCASCGQALRTQNGSWGQWSDWMLTPVRSTSAREVERRQALVGYNMFHYRTRLYVESNDRVFRNFSIEDDYKAFRADPDFGEEYAERYASLADLSLAERVSPDPWNVCPGKGYQDGVIIAFDLQDDNSLWFLGSAVYKTVYRVRELRD